MSWFLDNVGSLATAGINVVGGLTSNILGNENTKDNNQSNNAFIAEQNQLNRDWQTDMWNKQNEYNTPYAQMTRLKEAGLNPNLVYGNGSAVGNSTSMASLPSQGTKRNEPLQAPNFSQMLMQYTQLQKNAQEISNLKKAAEVMDADTELKGTQSLKNISESAKTDQDRQFFSDVYAQKVAQVGADLGLTNARTENVQASTSKISDEINKIRQDILFSKQATRESKQRILESESRVHEIAQKISESKQRIELMKAQGMNLEVQTEINRMKSDLWSVGVNPDSASASILTSIGTASMAVEDALVKPTWQWLKNKYKSISNNASSNYNGRTILNKR